MQNNFVYYNHSYILECPEIPLEGKMQFRDIQKKYVLENWGGGGGGVLCIFVKQNAL